MIKKSLLIVVVCMNVSMAHAMESNRVHGNLVTSTPLEKEYRYALEKVGWDVPYTERALVHAETEEALIFIIDCGIADSNDAGTFYSYKTKAKQEEAVQAVLKVFRKYNQQAKL